MLTLHFYDPNDSYLHLWRVGTSRVDDIWKGVTSDSDIFQELRRLGSVGWRINDLWFHLHGSPGVIALSSGVPVISTSSVFLLTNVCLAAMAAPARICWLGCNVGEGPDGEAFLRAAGRAMLGGGGGVMLAATSVVASGPVIGERLPPWAQVRAAKVSPGGAVVISTSSYVAWSNLQSLWP
jgi:hypothetical protein